MGFFGDIVDFVTDPIASIATGLLGQKGASDRNEQQIAMAREQMAWQERLSNTAHQREVADLNAAGLNPILSARAGASTLDSWHLAQKFSYRPLLNDTFIAENPPISRVSAVNTSLTNQFIFDSFFNIKMARPMPMYSVPGSVDHF